MTSAVSIGRANGDVPTKQNKNPGRDRDYFTIFILSDFHPHGYSLLLSGIFDL